MLKARIQIRRTKLEMEEDKRESLRKQLDIEDKMAQQIKMEVRIIELEQELQNNAGAGAFIEQLLQEGVLFRDQNGNICRFYI